MKGAWATAKLLIYGCEACTATKTNNIVGCVMILFKGRVNNVKIATGELRESNLSL